MGSAAAAAPGAGTAAVHVPSLPLASSLQQADVGWGQVQAHQDPSLTMPMGLSCMPGSSCVPLSQAQAAASQTQAGGVAQAGVSAASQTQGSGSQTQGNGSQTGGGSRADAAAAWRAIQDRMKPPMCKHNEPAVIRQVRGRGVVLSGELLIRYQLGTSSVLHP